MTLYVFLYYKISLTTLLIIKNFKKWKQGAGQGVTKFMLKTKEILPYSNSIFNKMYSIYGKTKRIPTFNVLSA